MSDGERLYGSVAANLGNDTPRLIFADWLEHSGDVDRANFIRLQIMIATGKYEEDGILLPATPEVVARFEGQARELLDWHRAEWEAPIRQALGTSCEEVVFHRGFPTNVSVNGVQELIDSSVLQSSHNTLTGLIVRNLGDQLPELLDHPGIATLTMLDSRGNEIGPAGAEAIANSQYLKNLTLLNLSGEEVENQGAIALASSPNLTKLITLDLSGNYIETTGAEAIANSPNFKNLATLNLSRNGIGNKAVTDIANSSHFVNLNTLNLSRNYVGDEGAVAIANSPRLKSLTTLDLSDNLVGTAGAEAIANSPNLANLTELNLARTRIGAAGATAISNSSHLKNLTSFDLGATRTEAAWAGAAANYTHLKTLNQVKEAAVAIAASAAKVVSAPEQVANNSAAPATPQTDQPTQKGGRS